MHIRRVYTGKPHKNLRLKRDEIGLETSCKSYVDHCKDGDRNRKTNMQLPPQDMSGLLFLKRKYYKRQDQEPCEFSCYHGGGIIQKISSKIDTADKIFPDI